ncbi:MAG: barstar family protein [Lentilitoribacter sp.]
MNDILDTCIAPFVFRSQQLANSVNNDQCFVLRGDKMRTYEGLYSEYSDAFNFPNYFGKNLNALIDVLTDLSWLNYSKYVVYIQDSEKFLADEPPQNLQNILAIMEEVGQDWSEAVMQGEVFDRDAIPFHTVLLTNSASMPEAIRNLTNLKLD